MTGDEESRGQAANLGILKTVVKMCVSLCLLIQKMVNT